MTPVKKLPPKPGQKAARPAPEAPRPYKTDGHLKATDIRIALEDGTFLVAQDGLAADIYLWLMDCERYCAQHPECVAPYLGEPWKRVDAQGNLVTRDQISIA